MDHVALPPDQGVTDYKSPCLCRAEIGKWIGSDCAWEDWRIAWKPEITPGLTEGCEIVKHLGDIVQWGAARTVPICPMEGGWIDTGAQ